MRPRSRCQLARVRDRLDAARAVQHDLGAVSAARLDLGRRRRLRHDDDGVNPGRLRGPGQRLRVIPGRHRDDAARSLGVAELGSAC